MKEIARRETGTRTILGTNWPVVDVVRANGKRGYLLTYGLCNGVPAGAIRYRTKREALAALYEAAQEPEAR